MISYIWCYNVRPSLHDYHWGKNSNWQYDSIYRETNKYASNQISPTILHVFPFFFFANKLPYICEFTLERETVTIQKTLKQQLHSITDEKAARWTQKLKIHKALDLHRIFHKVVTYVFNLKDIKIRFFLIACNIVTSVIPKICRPVHLCST